MRRIKRGTHSCPLKVARVAAISIKLGFMPTLSEAHFLDRTAKRPLASQSKSFGGEQQAAIANLNGLD
jgi:hypothetical protein